MLFHITWDFIANDEQAQARSLAVFQRWQPPEGAEFKGFYGTSDGRGGVAIVEADLAATIARTTAAWGAWLRFTVTPILPIEESAAINGEALAWLSSIS